MANVFKGIILFVRRGWRGEKWLEMKDETDFPHTQKLGALRSAKTLFGQSLTSATDCCGIIMVDPPTLKNVRYDCESLSAYRSPWHLLQYDSSCFFYVAIVIHTV